MHTEKNQVQVRRADYNFISAKIERQYLESVCTPAELKAHYEGGATVKKKTMIAAYGGGRKAQTNKRDVATLPRMLPTIAVGFVTSLFFAALFVLIGG
jgi:hypothetical protein